MGFIIGGSIAFSVGGAFLKATHGFTRALPTMIVLICFVTGAAMLARATVTMALSTTIVVGLGFEALATVAIGMFLLGDRLTHVQTIGMVFVLVGVGLVRL